MMDCFLPLFQDFLSEHKESIELFTRWIYIISELTSVFSSIKMGVNILTVKHDRSIS